MPIEIAKTNMYVVDGPSSSAVLVAKTNMYVVDNGEPESPTEDIQVFQAALMAGLSGNTEFVHAVQASMATVILNNAESIEASKASLTVAAVSAPEMIVTSASYQVVCLGRVELPHILAWPATLDGHDYYFLQLSDVTLVYDFHSQQWYNWGSGSSELWRAQIGIDWNANLGHIIGQGGSLSSIIVGDYISGALYFLDTNKAEDDNYEEPENPDPFQRLAYGQITLRGIDYISCDGVQVAGSIGEAVSAGNMEVTLSYSDDQGHTFYDAGAITMENGDYELNLHWRSLGSFRGPGRLFKITDWGGLFRIDGMDLDDGNADES